MKKLHPEDPKLTAYILGELPPAEMREIEREAALRPDIQTAIDDLIMTGQAIHGAYSTGRMHLDEGRRAAIHVAGRSPQAERLVMTDRKRHWRRATLVTSAAAILILAVVLTLKNTPVTSNETLADSLTEEQEVQLRLWFEGVEAPDALVRYQVNLPVVSGSDTEIASAEEAGYQAVLDLMQENPDLFFEGVDPESVKAALPNLLRLPELKENPFVSANEVARTQIPVTSGTMGYKLVERFVRDQGVLPPRATVRIEELINHVPYRDTGDAILDDVMLGAELVRCPWDPEKLLLSVLVQNRTDKLLPADTALALEVNSDFIRSYRLIGYASGDGKDSSHRLHRGLGADRSNMVLYELQPATSSVLRNHEVLCRAGLSLGAHIDRALIVPVASPPRDWNNSSLNMRTAAVIAGYGMVLRESNYRGKLNAELLAQLAKDVLKDADLVEPQQQEALELVRDSLRLLAHLDH